MSSEKDSGAVLIAAAIVFAALVIVAGMIYLKTMP
jgi:hypothetical protein